MPFQKDAIAAPWPIPFHEDKDRSDSHHPPSQLLLPLQASSLSNNGAANGCLSLLSVVQRISFHKDSEAAFKSSSNHSSSSFFNVILEYSFSTMIPKSGCLCHSKQKKLVASFFTTPATEHRLNWIQGLRYHHNSFVEVFLRDNPDIDINESEGQWAQTFLHDCANFGSYEAVKILLAHPNINVNSLNSAGCTPLLLACESGEVSVVQLLLKDSRVDSALADVKGCSPLWYASYWGNNGTVEVFIASGRDFGDIKNQKGTYWTDGKDYTALEIASERNSTKVVCLLERFMANPTQTRLEVRTKLGVLDEFAAELFALTVFLCDDLLQVKPAPTSTSTTNPTTAAAFRFFTAVKRLPMELQILCHRVVGSAKDSILLKDSEPAFKALARILLLSQSEEVP